MNIDNSVKGAGLSGDEIVEENTEASMPDESYSFDEDNTGDEEYHDTNDEGEGELDFDLDGDRMDEVTQENDNSY